MARELLLCKRCRATYDDWEVGTVLKKDPHDGEYYCRCGGGLYDAVPCDRCGKVTDVYMTESGEDGEVFCQTCKREYDEEYGRSFPEILEIIARRKARKFALQSALRNRGCNSPAAGVKTAQVN